MIHFTTERSGDLPLTAQLDGRAERRAEFCRTPKSEQGQGSLPSAAFLEGLSPWPFAPVGVVVGRHLMGKDGIEWNPPIPADSVYP